jgi:hypothetical protein
VVDVDPRHGGLDAWLALVKEHGNVPEGPVALTGSGGYHFFFAYPGQTVPSRSGSVGEGIDQRGDGGYAILPPSVHVTGASYQWCEDRAPWQITSPSLPPWLFGLLTRAPKGGGTGGGHRFDERVPEGQRRTKALSLAGTLRSKGCTREVIQAALLAWNLEQCDPPMALAEISALAADAARRWDPQVEVPVLLPSHNGKREKYTPRPFTIEELFATELPAVKWAVEGLLPEGLAVLAGKPKMGKSFLSFNIGLAVAEGGIALGQVPVEGGDVLIMALEDNGRRLTKRIKQMIASEPPPDRFYMEVEWPRDDEGGLEALDAWLGQHPTTRLVVIDPLAKFRARKGDPKYADDYAAIEGLQALAGRHGICILLITHYRKALSDDGDWVDQITGTLGIAGAADTLWGLTRSRGASDAVLLITGRDVEQQELALEWDKDEAQWNIVGTADEYALGKETGKLVECLEQIGGAAKVNDIASRMGKKRGATAVLCWRAAKEGHVLSYGNGMYAARPRGSAEM